MEVHVTKMKVSRIGMIAGISILQSPSAAKLNNVK